MRTVITRPLGGELLEQLEDLRRIDTNHRQGDKPHGHRSHPTDAPWRVLCRMTSIVRSVSFASAGNPATGGSRLQKLIPAPLSSLCRRPGGWQPMLVPEWDPYACQIPKPVGYTAKPCSELTEVHHVVHVPAARRILEDGTIRAGLVYDESRLNRSRLCVTWLSANTWTDGSIYGTVQFTFDWGDIINGQQIYWVEAMTDYSPSAYRLLLTDRNLAKSSRVQVYDPTTDDGPLKRKGKTWYWNRDFTSEFMVEADLSLSLCKKLSFIRHHETICRLNGPSCPEKRIDHPTTGGRIMAFILGNALHGADEALLPDDTKLDPDKLGFGAEAGITGIWRALGKKASNFGGGIKNPTSRQAVLRGALALYGSDQKKSAKSLAALLVSQDIFDKALCEVMATHFHFSNYQLPD